MYGMACNFVILLVIPALVCGFSLEKLSKFQSLECYGEEYHNVTLAAYISDDEYYSAEECNDVRGKKLRNLQDYLDGRTEFVTLAMDQDLALPYGTRVCIPQLNHHFGKRLNIQVRDIGDEIRGKKYTRADICVRSEADSYDLAVNRLVTLVF